jgi:hypothetical protein
MEHAKSQRMFEKYRFVVAVTVQNKPFFLGSCTLAVWKVARELKHITNVWGWGCRATRSLCGH